MKYLIKKLPVYGVCIHSNKVTCYETTEELDKLLNSKQLKIEKNDKDKKSFLATLKNEAKKLHKS